MNDLQVSFIQSNLYWEDSLKNLEMFRGKIEAIHEHSDLVILPEMFNTGFTMNSKELAQERNGEVVEWMKVMAQSKGFGILGSTIIVDEGKYYNRLVYADNTGKTEYYDKRHLFRMAGEHNYFSAGSQKKIITVNSWNINLQVCYDLRFPVWSRNKFEKGEKTASASYDLMVYVANWPMARVNAWDVLLQARAIENQCYVIGVNRVGNDGNGIPYNGHSKSIDPKGNVMVELEENKEGTTTVSLSYEKLSAFREKFPVGMDAD